MDQKPFTAGRIAGLVILAVLVFGVLWAMVSYNALVRLDEDAKTAQSNVEAQYQRRFDLIPNLVNTAKGIGGLELEVFTKLAEARSRYAGAPSGSAEKVAAINDFNSSLSRLLVVVENYPTLKSSESFLKLQDQLEGTENRISVSRNQYNDAVNDLNKKTRVFPTNIIARFFGFSERTRFEAVAEAEAAPKVEFDFK